MFTLITVLEVECGGTGFQWQTQPPAGSTPHAPAWVDNTASSDTHKPAKMAGLMLSVLITKNNKDRQTERREGGKEEGRKETGNFRGVAMFLAYIIVMASQVCAYPQAH